MGVTEDSARTDPAHIGTPHELAGALSLLRERAGLTVRDVHKRTGIATSTLGGYFSGRHRPSTDGLTRILAACGVTDPGAAARWTEALLRVRRADRRRAPGPCPYRGLEPFLPEHGQWFFGRTALVEAVTRRLLECRSAGRPLVVIGPSGAGKSSLLGAGVIPELARAHGMQAVALTPGPDPLATLGSHLPDGTDGATAPDVVVVDQFEEIFAPGVPPAVAATFASALHELSSPSPGAVPVAVVIGLRADFYADAVRLPELAAALQAGHVVVGPMEPKELREVIVEPAVHAGIEVDDGLADLLLEDLGMGDDAGEPAGGALPLLSHALLSTWQRSDRIRMTLADYRATGGVRGGISASAEDAVARLGPEREDVVRQLFLRLVHIGPDVAVTRRRVERAELLDSPDAPATLAALDEFVRHRLLVVDGDSVQIAHETLLVAWPRLRAWIDADRAGVGAHRQVTDAARHWREHAEDPDGLLRGARLSAALDRFGQHAHAADLNELERRFLRTSAAHEAADAAAARVRTRRLRRLLATVTVLFLVATGLGAYALEQRVEMAGQRDLAVSRQLAVRSDSLRDEAPALAAQLAVAGYRAAPTAEARSSLLNSTAVRVPTRLLGPAAVTQSLAVQGDVLVSATGALATAQVWRLDDTGRPRFAGDTAATTAPVRTVTLGPDARTIAAGSTDGRIVLLDLDNPGAPPSVVRAGGGTVLALDLTPDGRTLLAGTADGLEAWDRATRTRHAGPGRPPPTGPIHAVAVSPDGTLVAAGGEEGVTSLSGLHGSTLTPITALPGSGGKVLAVAFGPDGRTVATAGDDRTVRLWDVADPTTPRALGVLTGPTNWVNSLAFAPDGGTIAAGSSDGQTWLWDTASGRVTARLPHPAPVSATVFLDERTVVTGAADGTARLWPVHGPVLTGFDDAVFALDFDITGDVLAIGPGRRANAAHLWTTSHPDGPRPLGAAIPNPPTEPVVSGSAALGPDGRTLAVGRVDGSVRLWDVTDPQRPVAVGPPLVGSTELVEHLTISPDGRRLAVSGDDNTVRLWDISDPAAARPIATLTAATSYVLASAFSADGRLLAAASADTNTYLWSLEQPHRPRLLATLTGPASYAYSPSFSPDGRLLAVGNADRTVRLWDLRDPEHPRPLGVPLVGPGNYVYSVAFSPDGATLAAGSTDGTVWLWDVTDPAAAAHLATLTGPTDAVFSVAWSPDGHELVAGSADHVVRVWRTDPQRAIPMLCARVGTPLTGGEWAKYAPDVAHPRSCG